MDADLLKKLLAGLRRGAITEAEAFERLRKLPFADLGHTKVDHHRVLRQGAGEVIFAPGKTPAQILAILRELRPVTREILICRVSPDQAKSIKKRHPNANYNPPGRTIRVPGVRRRQQAVPGKKEKPAVLILSAGTADLPVVEETRETLLWLGIKPRVINDVGVAGIHRLFAHHEEIRKAAVLIVVAGMEGALASVVGGLVDKPVIAVPVSVGYGAGAGGVAALLAMLNSCASGVTVMNIDNGFGAACAAGRILRLLEE